LPKRDKDKKKITKGRIIFYSLLAAFLVSWPITWIPVTEKISLDLIPEEKGTVRIALITDLHSCYYGKNMKTLISMIDKQKPDLILLGGDIFDDKLSDKNTKIFMEAIVKKYPCYYVTGNHEYWSKRADEMKAYMESIGVNVLAGDCVTVTVNNVDIDICGVDDPYGKTEQQWTEQLDKAWSKTDESHLKILLTHRPEKVSVYEKYGFDLILAGHAHAGQFRIPFINKGVMAPDQGFMAQYVNGTYTLSNGSIMEVSRGLGRESTPLPRYFNNPEIVILDIH
jgi:predicted MPP superfamily phosphohydrolase